MLKYRHPFLCSLRSPVRDARARTREFGGGFFTLAGGFRTASLAGSPFVVLDHHWTSSTWGTAYSAGSVWVAFECGGVARTGGGFAAASGGSIRIGGVEDCFGDFDTKEWKGEHNSSSGLAADTNTGVVSQGQEVEGSSYW